MPPLIFFLLEREIVVKYVFFPFWMIPNSPLSAWDLPASCMMLNSVDCGNLLRKQVGNRGAIHKA